MASRLQFRPQVSFLHTVAEFPIAFLATLLVVGLGVVCHLARKRVRNADVMRDLLFLVAAVLVVVIVLERGGVAVGGDHDYPEQAVECEPGGGAMAPAHAEHPHN